MKLIGFVLWFTIGALLVAVGYSLDSWQFWCFLGTYWAVGQLSRQRGRVEGIIDYIEMSPKDEATVKKDWTDAKEKAE